MNYSDNYYVRTKAYTLDSSKLNESIQCDVCIVGAGLSGITTAFYLNKIDPNLKIVILEKNKIGWGASGRNGGQLLHGFSSEDYSKQKHSEDEIKTLWNFTVDAVREVKKNIKDLNLDCDLIEGYLLTSVTKSHDEELKRFIDQLQNQFKYESAQYLSKNQMQDYFDSPYYQSAMYDSECGQIHPLNYCLGLAKELLKLKFKLCATRGTAEYIRKHGMKCKIINKVSSGTPHIVDVLDSKKIALVINTGGGNSEHRLSDAIALRRATLKNKVPYCTNMSTAQACLEAIRSLKTKKLEVTSLQDV